MYNKQKTYLFEIEKKKEELNREKNILFKLNKMKTLDQAQLYFHKFYPYLLSTGIISLAFFQHNQIPFFKEKHETYQEYLYQFSSAGLSQRLPYFEEQTNIENIIDTISYYETKLEEETQTYNQKVSIYSIAEKEKEKLLSYYDNPINCNYQEFMNKLVSSNTKAISIPSSEAKAHENYYQATVLAKDYNTISHRKETAKENRIDSILYLITCTFFWSGIYAYRKKRKISFKEIQQELQKHYDSEIQEAKDNIKSLKKELNSISNNC
ncbi:MAG: hypothetical protein IJ743_05525 [Bacilli bacterium]|nr:hypothetical protein [Bacilli bacterium]